MCPTVLWWNCREKKLSLGLLSCREPVHMARLVLRGKFISLQNCKAREYFVMILFLLFLELRFIVLYMFILYISWPLQFIWKKLTMKKLILFNWNYQEFKIRLLHVLASFMSPPRKHTQLYTMHHPLRPRQKQIVAMVACKLPSV